MGKRKWDFSWGQVVIAAFLPALAQLMWMVYNNFVPLWLQAGNPNFSLPEGTLLYGFGYGAFVTGVLLTLDNALSLIVSPIIGMLSDNKHTRWGRRKPWIVGATPISILAFILIPILAMRIPAELNGQTQALTNYFIPFFISLALMMLPLAIIEVPAMAIIFDISPSKHRGTVNAVSNVVGAVVSIAAGIIVAALFGLNPMLPFLVAGIAMVVMVLLTALFVKEPKVVLSTTEEMPENISIFNLKPIFRKLKTIPRDYRKSLLFLVLGLLALYIGIGMLQAFISSYCVSTLGMEPATAGMVFAVGALGFLLATFPAAIIANKISRRKTVMIGLLIFACAGLISYIYNTPTLVWIYMIFVGCGMAFSQINLDVMVIDSAPDDELLGTYSGFIVIAKTGGMILGPIIGGSIIEGFGNNYANMWIGIAVATVIGFFLMRPVTRGEARMEQDAAADPVHE